MERGRKKERENGRKREREKERGREREGRKGNRKREKVRKQWLFCGQPTGRETSCWIIRKVSDLFWILW